jgi:RimJ/RimL family protein N-acetyltransferase
MARSGNLDVMGAWNGVELDILELRTDRLLLRPWQPTDAEAVLAIMADQRMSEYLPLPRPYTDRDARDFVSGYATEGRSTGSRLECAVVAGGRLVGAAGLRLPVGGTEPEIGYWIASTEWGNGYAAEAARALADFGFANGLPRIKIVTDIANHASVRVAMAAGFTFEGVSRQLGRSQRGLADHAVFARLATDPGGAIRAPLPDPGELSDGVVLLRQLRSDDWPVAYAEAANPESARWGFGGSYTEQEAMSRAASAQLRWLVGRGAELLICDAVTGAGAGVITLRQPGPPGVAAFGYGVLPEYRGRRFTARALELVAEWAFSRTKLVRLELGCKEGNIASARSAELAGFVYEGRYPSRLINPDGTYSDELGFGRVRPNHS